MEEEEQAFQQQRRRLYAEIQEEKERLASQAQKQRKELHDLKEKLEVQYALFNDIIIVLISTNQHPAIRAINDKLSNW